MDYLGWYVKWDPQEIYYYVTKNSGFEIDSQRVDGTYGRYAGLDDKFEWIHFYAQYIKFGLGRADLMLQEMKWTYFSGKRVRSL